MKANLHRELPEIDWPLEIAFAEHILKDVNFYRPCNSHIWSDRGDVPYFKFDIGDKVWEIDWPDNLDNEIRCKLEQMLQTEYFNFTIEDEKTNFKLEYGFDITTDINGYRILADIPISYWWERRDELVDEFYMIKKAVENGDSYSSITEMEEVKEELEEVVIPAILKAAADFRTFKQWFEMWKTISFKDYVVTIDQDGNANIMHKDRFEDEKEEFGLKLWGNKNEDNS